MPIYEYRCSSCNDDFEISQKITDAPLAECPKCHGPLEKLVSQTSFVLKGGGWYASDYGGGKGASKEGASPCSQGGSSPACSGCPSAGG